MRSSALTTHRATAEQAGPKRARWGALGMARNGAGIGRVCIESSARGREVQHRFRNCDVILSLDFPHRKPFGTVELDFEITCETAASAKSGLDGLGRTEDLRFAPNGRQLAL